MSNVIPGTNHIASPGVKSAFAMYKEEREARESGISAGDEAVEIIKAAAKAKVAKQPKTNDKKVAALRIFDANGDKNNGAIATIIAKELEITYANAYYYVTRVFKR